jgi:hypothetical protein
MKITCLALLALLGFGHVVIAGVGPEKLKREILALRSDREDGNCREAMGFLTKNIEEEHVRAALLAELYGTKDWQARESCLVLLCRSKSFQPDEKFMRMVLARIHAWGRPEHFCCEPGGDVAAVYLVNQVAKYPDLIAGEIRESFSAKDNSLWVQYVIIRALAKARLIDRYADRFSPAYLKSLASNLQDDSITCSAMVATGAFLFLGKIGMPVLKDVPHASDLQGREYASSILTCLSGDKSFSRLAEDDATCCGALCSGDLGDFDLDKAANAGEEDEVLVGPVPEHPEEIPDYPEKTKRRRR